jgi:membrane protease subunit (stomatin/prohibitin family)
MPLLRGVARTAVIAGTATAVSNRTTRRQEGRWAQQEQQQYEDQQRQMPAQAPAEAAAPPAQEDPMAKLKQLGELHDSGVLTDEEFSAAKAKILA